MKTEVHKIKYCRQRGKYVPHLNKNIYIIYYVLCDNLQYAFECALAADIFEELVKLK